MATPNGNGITRELEAMQSVVPWTPTDPRQFHLVSADKNLSPAIFRRRFHLVLYYNKAEEEDSGWVVAGRIKVSLGKALAEQPRFAGRLRRSEDGKLYLTANDSGVRLFEARIGVKLEEFLNMEGGKAAAAQLVLWEDIDEKIPETSPLLFVQVTNFICGGYSIGFSCSILLADPFTMIDFIKRWADVNRNMISNGEFTELPLFYFPSFRKAGSALNISNISILSEDNTSQSLIFKLSSGDESFLDYETQKTVAKPCLVEAARIIGGEIPVIFCLFVKQVSGEIKVEKLSRYDSGIKSIDVLNGVVCGSWDDFGVGDMSIQDGNKPAGVSTWIGSATDEGEGLVMVILHSDEGKLGMKIIVTIHNDKAV